MSDERSVEYDPQPMPVAGDGRDVMRELAGMIEERRIMGIRKYGRALEPGNGRDALRDLLAELLDACAYTMQAIMERDKERSR